MNFRFIDWAIRVGLPHDAANVLGQHLQPSRVDTESSDWLESLDEVMAKNFPCDVPLLDARASQCGLLLVGHCPNGDPVFVNFTKADYPVFYGNYGSLYKGDLENGLVQVMDSFLLYKKSIYDPTVKIPKNYWDAKSSDK